MNRVRTALVGVGSFGRNHARVLSTLAGVELTAVVDVDANRAEALAQEHNTAAWRDIDSVIGKIDAAVIATPTQSHEEISLRLLEAGIDVLVEKPIAPTAIAGELMNRAADRNGRILQVGHLERFNPAVLALEKITTLPLFFEVHRLSVFTPRSLDVDVVLDLMIHDLDIILSLTGASPEEVRAAGISVLSKKVDIANVRLAFSSGCIANLTASRVSTERIRKLRLFQPREYISVDYQRQDVSRLALAESRPERSASAESLCLPKIGFENLPVERAEPLQLELMAFFHSVRTRSKPRVDGQQAVKTLSVAESILANIEAHTERVAETIRRSGQPSRF